MVFFCTVIAVIDIKTCRIPNALLLCFALLLAFVYRNDQAIILRLASSLAAFLIFAGVYVFTGGMGLGDVKYAAVLGYGLSFDRLVPAFFIAALFAFLVFFIDMVFFRWNKLTKIPFAPFLSCGAIAAVIRGITLTGFLP